MKPVAVLFALPIEAQPFVRMLSRLQKPKDGSAFARGFIENQEVYVGLTGMGCTNARLATARNLSEMDFNALIFAGFAGGLADELRPGELLVADTILDARASAEDVYACDTALLDSLRCIDNIRLREGRILTIDRIIDSTEEKARLSTQYNCAVVDMESAAAAKTAICFKVPFLAIRSVLDPASEHMPAELTSVVDPDGRTNIRALCQAMWRNPSLVYRFLRLYHRSNLVARNLAILLEKLIVQLPQRNVR